MPTLPSIYLIHASDVPQHVGKLMEILQKLKEEHRIDSFTELSPDDQLAQIQGQDLVLMILSHAIEPQKSALESSLKSLQVSQPEVKIAEIIVDQIPYENEFITFPSDLKHIRGRDDMDAVWRDIEQSLKDMFPIIVIVDKDGWKKYVKYIVLAVFIIVIAILIWWFTKPGKVVANFSAKPTECVEPCSVSFENISENAKEYRWDFGDGNTSELENPTHIYETSGNYPVMLIASSNKQMDTATVTIKINPLPIADFSITNNGCEAPCPIEFENTSRNADTFTWYFGDGEESDARNPSHEYKKSGNYVVTLAVRRGDLENIITDTVKITDKTPSPQVFNVTGVKLEVSSRNYSGNCPYKIDFTATITVNGAGSVQYSCLRKDGTSTPVETIQFQEAGSKTITTPSWTYGEAGKTYMDLWQEVRIIAPNKIRSDRAYFNLTCTIPCTIVAKANAKVYEDPENIRTRSEIINLGVRGTISDEGTYEVIERKIRASTPFYKIRDQETGMEGWVHDVFNDIETISDQC